MPIDPATDFLWEATGHATSTTSVVVTHPDAGGTTAGSTVVVVIRSSGAINFTAPDGWAKDLTLGIGGLTAYRLDDVAAAVTSWTFTRSTSGNSAWYMLEADHLSPAEAFEVASAGTNGTNATGTTRSTATSALNAGSGGVVLAVFGSTKAGSGDTHSWGSYTNSFSERVDFNPAGVAGQCIAVAAKAFAGQGTFESTATFTTSTGSPSTAAVLLVYRADDADINAPLEFFTGFEFGTHAGLGNAAVNNPVSGSPPPSGTWGTNYSVIAGAAHNGGYGLEVNAVASIANVPLPSLASATINFSGSVKPVSGTGTPVALSFSTGGGGTVWLDYDVTNEKFGLRWSSGSTVWQTGTTALNAYPVVQIRAKANGSVWHADWWIETGTGDGFQTSPTDPTGMSPVSSFNVYLGSALSQTSKFHYDDVVYSRHYAAWPLAPHVVRLLVPETTGASVSGTAGNFNQFTANGTLAAFASTNGALLDEVPPTVSASSDGVVQVTLAASDYMNFPMTTYALTSSEIIAGVRALASLWGGTGSGTGTLGFRGYDGTTETIFVAAGTSFDPDSLTAISATYPLWYAAMWPGAANGAWTQAKLDAAALRVGFSTDATPDMGVSALYLEVATRATPVFRQITTGEADEFTVDLRVDPYNSASVSYLIESTDATRGATFYYSISGTPQTPVVVAPASTEEVVVNAASFGEISDVSLEPDA